MPQAARCRDVRRYVIVRRGKRRPVWAQTFFVPARTLRCLILVLPAVASGTPTHAAPAAAHSACVVYRQFDRQCHCLGADHYFLNYGEKYCERFMRATGWSPGGRRWRDRTMACLSHEMRAHLAQGPHGCDCGRIKTFALESHARCYTQKPLSACALPLSDLAMIFRMLDLKDLVHPEASRQILGVTLSCLWQNGNAQARREIPTQ